MDNCVKTGGLGRGGSASVKVGGTSSGSGAIAPRLAEVRTTREAAAVVRSLRQHPLGRVVA